MITASDVILVVGGHSQLGQAVISSATSRGLHTVAVVGHDESAVAGCETLHCAYMSDALHLLDFQSTRDAVAERYSVVHHLVVAPDYDPFVGGHLPGRKARNALFEQMDVFRGFQRRMAIDVSALVSPYGSVALSMPPRLTQGQPFTALFSTDWLPQVQTALQPRLVYLVAQGPAAGDTWLAAAASETASTTLFQDRTAKARLDALYGNPDARHASNERGGAPDLYELLGITRTATTDQIRYAFRDLSKRIHPDAGGNAMLFRLVCDAYEILSDPHRRATYDRGRS